MRRSSRLTAALIAASLVLVSPGLPCYQAFAAEFNGGAPKGIDVKAVPALDLSAAKSGALQLPGAGIPAIQTAIPQAGIPAAGIPVLPPSIVATPGAALTNAPQSGAGFSTPNNGVVERPLAETTLRTGEAAISGAKEGEQAGVLDAFYSGDKKGAAQSGASFVAAGQNDAGQSQSSVAELQSVATDQTKPFFTRLSAVKAIADRSDDPAKLALEEIGTIKPVGDAQDYEVRRHALRALAQKGKLVSLPEISAGHKQEILSKLAKDKPKIAIFDYDGTLEPRGAKATPETGAALKAMTDAGVRVAILTGRPYVSREPGQTTIQESLSTLTPEQQKGLEVLSDRGARSFSFKDGKPVLSREAESWTATEKRQLEAASAFFRDNHGLGSYEGKETRSDDYSFTLYLRSGVNLEAAAASFSNRLKMWGVKADVMPRAARDGKPASLLVNKYDKSTGVAALGAQGASSVLIGDYFFGENSVDGGMAKGAPGALSLAVGGSADPRIENVFVWDKQGPAAAREIGQAVGKPLPVAVAALKKLAVVGQRASGILGWLKSKWNAEGPKAPGPDDPVNVKTLLGNIIPSVISMGAYMLVTLGFYKVATETVGDIGYGILMSLSPMAGIAAANIMGNVFRKMGARNAMVINTLLRILSLSALPLLHHFFGALGMGSLLIGALAEGFLLSSIMTTSGAFLPALFPSKQIGNINGVMFMMFPLVQVVLGIWAHIGRFADFMSPFTIFSGAAALNVLVALLTWLLIPNTKLAQNQPAAGAAAAPKAPLATRAMNFVKAFWKPMLALTAAVGLFAGLTWGLPALAAAGVGGKLIAGAAAFFKAHAALRAPLPIAAALVYWITKTQGFKALREGKAAKITDAEKTLSQKISELEAQGSSKADELAAARAEMKTYQGRQLKSIALMSLGTLMYYPLYLMAAPQVAKALASTGGLDLAGQFLGSLFFGALLSTSARTALPGKINVPLPGGRKFELTSTRAAQALFSVLAGLFAATKLFAAGGLLASAGIAVGGAVVAAGLIYLATRITDRGWIQGAGLGFAAVWLPFAVWTWPALIPFLTIKTAMLLSLLAAGYVNGPNFVSLISYLMSNTERSENSKVTGVQGAFFNAAISFGYGVLTIASGFLNPAYPAVLAVLGVLNLLVGGVFWRTASHLPGLSPTFFKPRPKKAQEPVK